MIMMKSFRAIVGYIALSASMVLSEIQSPTPTRRVTESLTLNPTPEPTPEPTGSPIYSPTSSPITDSTLSSASPTPEPTQRPTRHPTHNPSNRPTGHPSKYHHPPEYFEPRGYGGGGMNAYYGYGNPNQTYDHYQHGYYNQGYNRYHQGYNQGQGYNGNQVYRQPQPQQGWANDASGSGGARTGQAKASYGYGESHNRGQGGYNPYHNSYSGNQGYRSSQQGYGGGYGNNIYGGQGNTFYVNQNYNHGYNIGWGYSNFFEGSNNPDQNPYNGNQGYMSSLDGGGYGNNIYGGQGNTFHVLTLYNEGHNIGHGHENHFGGDRRLAKESVDKALKNEGEDSAKVRRKQLRLSRGPLTLNKPLI